MNIKQRLSLSLSAMTAEQHDRLLRPPPERPNRVTVYHGTSAALADSIARNELSAGSGRDGRCRGRVYVTTDEDRAIWLAVMWTAHFMAEHDAPSRVAIVSARVPHDELVADRNPAAMQLVDGKPTDADLFYVACDRLPVTEVFTLWLPIRWRYEGSDTPVPRSYEDRGTVPCGGLSCPKGGVACVREGLEFFTRPPTADEEHLARPKWHALRPAESGLAFAFGGGLECRSDAAADA